jgi:type VI secretion system protein VasD
MRASPFSTILLWALCVATSTAACRSKPPSKAVSAVAVVSIRAHPDTNPGPDGRPSPIVLRLYLLKSDAAFINADYFPLFDDEKRVLGADLVSREEQELIPGQTVSVEVPFTTETRFIGFAGGYYDTGRATWRAVTPAPGSKGHSVRVVAVAERARVTVSVVP